jgi:AcrR family transcriptional regulator
MPRSEAENERRRERQRANILDAAMEVFARSGLSASMAEIAAAAGVSQGLAYRYFASKQELYYALLEHVLRVGIPDALREQAQFGSPGQALQMLISRVLTSRREHPEFFQLLYHVLNEGGASSELLAQINERGQLFQEIMRNLIVQGQATGETAEGDPDQLVLAFMAYLDGLTHLSLYDMAQYKAHFPDPEIILRIFKPGSATSDE